ncbi:MAG: NfeD family protein [Pseudomonadota bacterium]
MDFSLGTLLLILLVVLVVDLMYYGFLTGLLLEPFEPLIKRLQEKLLGIDKPIVGSERIEGGSAIVVDAIDKPTPYGHEGTVRFESEIWAAQSRREIESGAYVEVTARNGLLLTVRPTHHRQ